MQSMISRAQEKFRNEIRQKNTQQLFQKRRLLMQSKSRHDENMNSQNQEINLQNIENFKNPQELQTLLRDIRNRDDLNEKISQENINQLFKYLKIQDNKITKYCLQILNEIFYKNAKLKLINQEDAIIILVDLIRIPSDKMIEKITFNSINLVTNLCIDNPLLKQKYAKIICDKLIFVLNQHQFDIKLHEYTIWSLSTLTDQKLSDTQPILELFLRLLSFFQQQNQEFSQKFMQQCFEGIQKFLEHDNYQQDKLKFFCSQENEAFQVIFIDGYIKYTEQIICLLLQSSEKTIEQLIKYGLINYVLNHLEQSNSYFSSTFRILVIMMEKFQQKQINVIQDTHILQKALDQVIQWQQQNSEVLKFDQFLENLVNLNDFDLILSLLDSNLIKCVNFYLIEDYLDIKNKTSYLKIIFRFIQVNVFIQMGQDLQYITGKNPILEAIDTNQFYDIVNEISISEDKKFAKWAIKIMDCFYLDQSSD